jgi:hypothetical protein
MATLPPFFLQRKISRNKNKIKTFFGFIAPWFFWSPKWQFFAPEKKKMI